MEGAYYKRSMRGRYDIHVHSLSSCAQRSSFYILTVDLMGFPGLFWVLRSN